MSSLNGNGGVVVKLVAAVGVPTFILFWLGGAFATWLPSPAVAALAEIRAVVARHDVATREVIRESAFTLRLICDAVWQEEPSRQKLCWRSPDPSRESE